MNETPTYRIKVNTSYALIQEIALALFFIAGVGFCIWYLVNLPVKDQPAEILIPYYLWLPRWLIDIFITSIVAGVLGLIILGIRKNTTGVLKIYPDAVEVKSKILKASIKYTGLKRINFISKMLSFHPYGIEFVYPSLKVTRIKVRSETDFDEIFRTLCKTAPKHLEIDATSLESPKWFDT